MNLDDRAPTIYGWAFALLGGGGILFFWAMGAIFLLNRDDGLIRVIEHEPLWRNLYFAYPVVLVAAVIVGGILVALRRDLASVAVAGSPVVLATLYYFALVHLRAV